MEAPLNLHPPTANFLFRHRRLGLVLALLSLLGAFAGAARGQALTSCELMIAKDREQQAIHLIDKVGFERPIATPTGPFVWDSIALQRDHAVYGLHKVGHPQDKPLATIEVWPKSMARPGDLTAGTEMAIRSQTSDKDLESLVKRTAEGMVQFDQGGFFVGEPEPPQTALIQASRWFGGALLLWLLALCGWLTRQKAWSGVQLRFKLTHLLPALIQITVYAFWASKVPAVRQQIPMILVLLLFAYALDFLLGMTLKRRWDLTFGPMPVTLSANLFVWFPPEAALLAFSVIAVAIGSKWLVHWGDGRHVFNPSAIGVAVVGLLALLFPGVAHYRDISHMINVPGMLSLLLWLALIAQWRVPVVLVTLCAALVLLGLKYVGAYHVVYPFWPAVFLALALLATDPATIPQTGPGRLLLGLLTGFSIWAFSAVLTWMGLSDFFGKVLPIALLCPASPLLDRAGRHLGRFGKAFEPKWNMLHVAVWMALACVYIYL